MHFSTIEIYKAIDNAQKSLLKSSDMNKAFQQLLKDVLEITSSPIGFFGEIFHDKNGPYAQMRAISNVMGKGQQKALLSDLEFHDPDSDILKPAITGDVIITFNSTRPSSRQPEGHPVIHSYIGIPVEFDNNIVGVIGLANAEYRYQLSCVSELSPLIKTIAVMIERKRLLKEQEQYNKRILSHAEKDTLTGFYNRWKFEELTSSFRPPEKDVNYIISCINIDAFRKINNLHGFDYGDLFIRKIAQVISQSIDNKGLCCRSSGDEFLLLSPEYVIYHIVEQFNPSITVHGRRSIITFSIGIALWDFEYGNITRTIQHAEHSMCQAKEQGGSTVVLYDDIANNFRLKQEKIALVRHAIEQNKVLFYLQPQVEIQNGVITGHEILIRIIDNDGIVYPDDFLPHISETETDVALGDYILENSFLIVDEIISRDILCDISINVSAYHLLSKEFVKKIQSLRIRYPKVVFSKIKLEITETSLINDIEKAAQILGYCKSIGLRISLDDFGTGYSSMNYFRLLPIDEVKIDKSFILDINHREESFLLVQHIISMVNSFGKHVIAEGIETSIHRSTLINLGCKYGQGYFYSQPSPWEKALYLTVEQRLDTE